MPDSSPPVADRRELRLVLSGLMLALTLAALDQNIVAPALPRIVSDLGGLTHLSWVVTAFLLTSTTSTPLYGKLSDLYGRKRAFVVSIVVFLIGSALCGLAQGMTELIVFRGLQGLGAGGLITLAQTTIGDLVTPRERGRYQGLFAAVFAACSVAGPLLGGVLTDALSWRWIFYVNLPIGALALALIVIGLKKHGAPLSRPIDGLGAALLMGGIGCLLLVLSWGGGTYPWASPVIVGLAVAAAGQLALLVVVEHRAAEPVLPPRLFHNRIFVLATAVMALSTTALFGALVFLPLFFQLVLGSTPSAAGLLMAPLMGGVITASVIGGRRVSATGRYKIFPVIGLAVAALTFAAMGWAAAEDVSVGVIEVILVALGLGIGFVMPNLTTAVQGAVPRADLGGATSAAAFFRSLGGAVGAALSGTILAARMHSLLPAELGRAVLTHGGMDEIAALPPSQHALVLAAYRTALSTTFLTGAAVAALAFVVVLFLPDRQLQGGQTTAPPRPSA